MSRPGHVLLLALLLGAFAFSGAAEARPGFTVPEFGQDGIARLGPEPGEAITPMSTGRQSDGSLLVAGRVDPGPRTLIARFRPDGTLDPSFGDGGTVASQAGHWDRLAVASDDGFLVAGGSGSSLTLTRFDAAGMQDPSFGLGGTASIDLSSRAAEAGEPPRATVTALTVLPDGRIRAAGTFFDCEGGTWDRQCRNSMLVGLTSAGALDSAYGGGIVIPESEGNTISAVFRDDGSSFILRDFNGMPDGAALYLGRFDSTGHQVGFRFGAIFNQYAPLTIPEGAGTMRLDPQGRILVAAGHTLFRFNQDGSLDESFSGSGSQQLNSRLGRYLDAVDGLPIVDFDFDDQGRILVTGGIQVRRSDDDAWASSAYVARILPSGEVDASFGLGGIRQLWSGRPSGGGERFGSGRVLVDGDTAVVSGSIPFGDRFGLALARVSLGEMTMPSCGGRTATLVGTEGDDHVVATDGVLVLLGGDDTVTQGLGARVCAGDGDDMIWTVNEASWVDTGPGDDEIYGGVGRDTLIGGSGNDLILGGDLEDRLFGGPGDDRLRGQQRDDQIFGGPGRDSLLGGAGRDQLHGGPGRDRLDAGGTGPPFVDYRVERPAMTLRLTRSGPKLSEAVAVADVSLDCIGDDPYVERVSMGPFKLKRDGTFRYRWGDRDDDNALFIQDVEGRVGKRQVVGRVRVIDSFHYGSSNYTCWAGSRPFGEGFDLMRDSWVRFRAPRLVRQRQFERQ